ncbi:hypothetical protein [Zhongshania aliphaticivorans]|uniref:hypothetical protein n=1 Tax=Zhongshania aliphaticivorans TaxID=1470434 RepID=UPI0012E5C135|nr:hypothetical protein [Zhongshania aliphaticivorans]CAA0099967.1 Uncharacterised protein [Zhongshania aliphaticivorans]
MTYPQNDKLIPAEDYELYMPLLEAMQLDLEETLVEKPDAVFYPGRSIVVNRFLGTLKSLLGGGGESLAMLDERGVISAESVSKTINSYQSAFLKMAPKN